jgi:hypothetical protein
VTLIAVEVVVPLNDASIVTVVFELTGLEVSVKTDWYEPCGTVTLVGTGNTDGLLLLKETVLPPDGALQNGSEWVLRTWRRFFQTCRISLRSR